MSEQEQSRVEPDRPPVTADPGVDRILTDLESQLRSMRADGAHDVVSALTEAHRRLQARLSDPGPTPPTRG